MEPAEAYKSPCVIHMSSISTRYTTESRTECLARKRSRGIATTACHHLLQARPLDRITMFIHEKISIAMPTLRMLSPQTLSSSTLVAVDKRDDQNQPFRIGESGNNPTFRPNLTRPQKKAADGNKSSVLVVKPCTALPADNDNGKALKTKCKITYWKHAREVGERS